MTMNRWAATLGAVMVAMGASMALAQQPDGAPKTQNIQTTETGWQVICRSGLQDRSKLACSVMHETYSAKDRVRLTSVEMIKNDKGRVMLVSVPQGVSLKDGIDFSIDGAKQSRLAFQYCMNNNCFSTLELTDAILAGLKKAKTIDLVFFDLQGSKIKTEIFMTGFVQALSKSD